MTGRFADLAGPDRVHRRIHTDPEVFAAEMEHIFGRAWLYVGHESQLAAPGDFVEGFMGSRSVIAARHTDGSLRVFLNRCSHRGMKVCSARRGAKLRFVCPFHGWTFATDGALVDIPARKGNSGRHRPGDPALALAPAARVAVHRGFVFATGAADGPDLAAYLGPQAAMLDALADASPVGTATLEGAMFRDRRPGNWKRHAERSGDLARLAGAAPRDDGHLIWPNLVVVQEAARIHVLQPVSVDCTIVHSACLRLGGMPDEAHRQAERALGAQMSREPALVPANPGAPDPGREAGAADWIDLPAAAARDGAAAASARMQYAAWRAYMAQT